MDGNDIKAPRNLIDFVTKSQEAQLRREEPESEEFQRGEALIRGDEIKRGLEALPEARVEDTLLAEAAPESARDIERFQDGMAEHDDASLGRLLDLDGDQLVIAIQELLAPLRSAQTPTRTPVPNRE